MRRLFRNVAEDRSIGDVTSQADPTVFSLISRTIELKSNPNKIVNI